MFAPGAICALDRYDGKPIWRRELPNECLCLPSRGKTIRWNTQYAVCSAPRFRGNPLVILSVRQRRRINLFIPIGK